MINVNAGETVNDVFLFEDQMNVYSEGTAVGTLVDKDSILTVYQGGLIDVTYISNMGEVDVLEGGTANYTQINTNGYLYVAPDGVASGTIVEGGNFSLDSNGIASDTEIRETGSMHVYADGKLEGTTTVNSGGSLSLEWGSGHKDVVAHGGKVTVTGDTMNAIPGSLESFTVDSGGSLTVSGYGSASSGTITDGFAKVLYDGTLENVTLNAATVEVKNGAMLSNATMNAGTVMNVESGATIYDLTVGTGAVLTGVLNNVLDLKFEGGTLDLNIAAMYPGDAVRVNSDAFNLISAGTYSCTLTVDSSAQTIGDYSLIEAVTSFDKTVTVQNTLGETLGTLTVGGDPLVCGILSYTLGLDSAGLFVTVGKGNIITGDVTGETKDVPSGWTALGVNVNVDGILNVLNGGIASDTTINNGGEVNVSNGGVASNTTVNSGGDLYLYEGGSARGVTINEGGDLYLNGTNANVEDVKVSAGGLLFALPGTSVKDIDAEAGAKLGLTVAKKTYAAGKYAGTPFEIKEVINDFTPFGGLDIVSGGIAINTIVNKDIYVYVNEGGLASNTTLFTDARMYVGSAGSAHIAYVSGGSLTIEDKGSAGLVNVGNLGHVYVSSGGVVSGLICYQYGTLIVSKGGVAGNVTVNKDGAAYVDGTVSGAYVADGGLLNIEGKITGQMTFETGATVTAITGSATLDFDLTKTAPGEPALVNDLSFTLSQQFSYTLTVDGTEAAGDYKLAEGATGFDAYITVVDTLGTALGTLTVAGGKTTIDGRDYLLTLTTGGSLGVTIDGGGGTVDLTGDLYATFELTAGMVGSSVNILKTGRLIVHNGGTASQTTITSGGSLAIKEAGALASQTTITSGGKLYVSEGGVATGVTANSGGNGFIYSGGTATGIVADEGAYFYIELTSTTYAQGTCGGAPFEFTAHLADCTIPSIFNLEVLDGGTADNVTVESEGWLTICDGAKATGVSVVSGGGFCVDSGGTATGIVAADGAMLNFDVAPNTYAQGTYGGSAFEISDTVTGYAIHSGGGLGVYAGGKADAVTVNFGGDAYIYVGATVTKLKENGGYVDVETGATAEFLPNSFGGYSYEGWDWCTIHSGTTGTDLTAGNFAEIHVYNGGTADVTTVDPDGYLYVYDGGKVTGKMTFEAGSYATFYDGSILDFDLTQTAPGADALVNDLSILLGTPGYTLTVDGTEADGDYKLAEGATGFDKTITVKDTLGATLGTLTVAGGKTTIDGKDYTLTLTGTGSLGVTVAGGGVDLTGDLDYSFDLTAGMVGSSVNILKGGRLRVLNGGFASQTTVKEAGGDLTVSSGGVASDTTVSGGQLFLSGGIASKTIIKTGAEVRHERGVASDTEIFEGGELKLRSSDSIAKDITIHSGGTLMLQGPDSIITGRITFDNGAVVTHYGTANTGIMNFDLTITAPGSDALVNNLALVMAEKFSYTLTVDGTEANGDYKLAEGATGFDKTITVKDTLGTTLGTLTVAGGKTTIGGRDYTLTLTTGGSLGVTVAGGGVDLTGDLDSKYNLEAGKYASSVNILEGGMLNVYKDALASQTAVNSGGSLLIYDGGIASDTTINDKGKGRVLVGGIASKTEITSGGTMYVSGTADSATIAAGGFLWANPGAKLNNFDVSSGGDLSISSGATATGIVAVDGARLELTVAPDTYVQGTYAGSAFEMKDAALTGFTIRKDAYIDVRADGVTSDVTVSGGLIRVYNGGVAKDTLVSAGGQLILRNEGAVANGVTIKAGGMLTFSEAGGKLTGKVTIETGAIISVCDGAIVDFDLTKTTTADPALVNKLSFFGTAAVNYTLTVDGTEAEGNYKLAEGATGFDKTITVVNTSGDTLDTLSVGEIEKLIGGQKYTLTLNGAGSLGVTLGDYTPAVDLTGDLDTTFELNAGMVGSSVNILDGGELNVLNDGFTSQTTVNSGGDLIVSAGGSADVVTVNEGGELWVSNGATATLVKENGGYVFVHDGATVTFVPNSFDGVTLGGAWNWATVHSGTTATNIVAAVAYTTVEVYDGGSANNTTVSAGGNVDVYSGGKAVDTTVAADGHLKVEAGGTATGIVAEAGARLGFAIAPGTYAQGTYAGSSFEITDTVADYTVNTLCNLYVYDGGTANNTTVSGGIVNVFDGGKADNTTVSAGGYLEVFSGGTATNIVWTPCEGYVYVYDGGYATFVSTYAGVYFGSDGELLESAAAMDGKKVAAYYEMNVADGGLVTNTTVDFGNVYVWSGGRASGTTLVNEGWLHISSGGVADNTTITDGSLFVSSGGVANKTTLNDKGIVEGNSGGLINGVVVNSGGSLLIYNGAKLTGQMTFVTGAEVIPFVGSILDFDLTQTAPDAAALVNDLSILLGTPGYTLTVGGSEVSGTYNLAGGATGFDKTITVMSPLGDEYGTLTVGGSLSTAFADYTLNLSSGVLTLDLVAKVVVDTTPPVVSNVAADITAPTNGNVTVTADFTDNVAVAQKLFKFNDEPWQAYPTGGVLVTENATVSFMAIDTSSNNSDVVVITIGNIDKVAPTITAITPSTTEPAASVTVTANFADDVGVAYQQFKIGDGAWQDYVDGVVVTENATVSFRAADAAGNVANASYDVTNIQTLEPDTTKPAVINVAADITAQTNGNVTVTAEFTDNVAVEYKYYTLSLYDMWQDYPDGGVVVTENNTTVYFEAIDTSGNTSDIVSITIDNIDKEAPTITGITPSTTAPAASVTVTATFSDNVALAAQQYKIGGGTWQNYVDGVLVTENALVTFKAVDTAGNETTETYDVTNISSGGGTVVTGDVTGETKDINTGMVASDVNVNANGTLNVYAGGLASKTTVNAEGAVVVSGGSAVQTTVNAGGELFLYAGGKADSTTDSGGTIHVYDGASATNTTLTGNGTIDICNGGAASSTTAENNGWIRVSAGGVTSDTTVKSGGKLILNGGGKITGKMTFETGAVVSAFENSIVDFNIYPLSPANEALVNNLSILQGTPIYTLTINGAQMLGTYNLAGGAAAFDQTITVQSILGTEVGTLTVGGGATKIGDVFYTLNLTGSDLTVTVSSGGEADTTKPVVTNVMASITTPTNGDVTITASFYDNVAVASSLYKINSGDWTNYVGGVTVTENATVYFKAIDTSGNESDVVSLTVSNIDKTAPEKPVASANVTAPTNGSVNVSATFAEDSVQNEYSMDGVNWAPYPGLVKFDNNGTVYFRSTDEVGNISEIESYAVTNIDKVPPAKPTASADITTTTSGNVTVTAVFSGDSAKKEFSLDGLVWQDYTAPLVFSANGKAYFRAADAAGNQSDIISYSVTNIQPATPDNAPDDSKNDWVYNKKTKEWNSEANLASFVVNNITAGDSEVRLDKVGSVEKDGKHNFVGRTGSDEDAADYAKIELSKGAALTFSVDSTIAGTFVVLQATKDKKGSLVTTQRQKISVKAGQTSPKKTTTIYLEAGEYFVGMEAKLPSAKKGDAAAYYNVNLAGTTFFNDADTGWNNTAYKLDGEGKEIKTDLNPELVSGAMLFGRGATAITLDTGAMGKDGYANWVGFSDAVDYRMLTLENAANVTLSLTATGKAKLAIWQVSTNAKSGVISLKSKGSVSVKAGATGLVKSKFLEAGTYFVSVESTDAKKGGSAYYNVSVDSASVFFDSADTGKNDELYDKKAKAFYPEDDKHHFVTTNVSGAGTSVLLDSDPVKADGYKNFVGYQDKIDYAKVNLTTDGNLFFKLKTTGEATFTVYRKGQDKKGNDTLETIQTTKLKLAKGASVIDKFTDVLSGLTAGEYYISMTATNTSTTAKGSVFYNVTATLEPSDAASLAMPETDILAGTDAMSFGRFDADALASASTASLADLDDKSGWMSLLA